MTPPRRGRQSVEARAAAGRRRRRRRSARHRRRGLLLVFAALVVVAAGVAVGGGATVLALGSSCDLAALRPSPIGENSFVFAADGSLLGAIPAERNRQRVPLRRISPWVPKATIAIEDRRFYSHGGIDPQGIARAVLADVRAREVVQGGSTIDRKSTRLNSSH